MILDSDSGRRYAELLTRCDNASGHQLFKIDQEMRRLLPLIPRTDMDAIRRRERPHALTVPGCLGGWDGNWRKWTPPAGYDP